MARPRREAPGRGRRARRTNRPAERPKPKSDWTRYAAPAAFLLAATIAILLIRSGLRGASDTDTAKVPTKTAVVTTARGRTTTKPKPKPGGAAYYTVVAGDTFVTIASKNGTTVARVESLNPGVKSTSLFIGQRIRVK